jgi:hypothetical protein
MKIGNIWEIRGEPAYEIIELTPEGKCKLKDLETDSIIDTPYTEDLMIQYHYTLNTDSTTYEDEEI